MINYSLTRSKRKTIAIHVQDGSVSVRAPKRAPQADIDRFVAIKEKWIIEKLSMQNDTKKKRDRFKLDYNSVIPYRGEQYPIVEWKIHKIGFFNGERFLIPPVQTPEQIKRHCINIYKGLAKSVIEERMCIYIKRMVVLPINVRITNAKKRWGSCTSDGKINIAWRLIMTDDDVIDYVIVHELAHLIEMNHSARFWNIVGGVLPDYKTRRAKLKEFQNKLINENWD